MRVERSNNWRVSLHIGRTSIDRQDTTRATQLKRRCAEAVIVPNRRHCGGGGGGSSSSSSSIDNNDRPQSAGAKSLAALQLSQAENSGEHSQNISSRSPSHSTMSSMYAASRDNISKDCISHGSSLPATM
jgi:hypothetical protein